MKVCENDGEIIRNVKIGTKWTLYQWRMAFALFKKKEE